MVRCAGEGTPITSVLNATARREIAAYRPAQVAAWLNLPNATVRAWAKGQYYDVHGKRRFFRPVIEPTRLGVPRNGPLAWIIHDGAAGDEIERGSAEEGSRWRALRRRETGVGGVRRR